MFFNRNHIVALERTEYLSIEHNCCTFVYTLRINIKFLLGVNYNRPET
jgi:hypothetical protein